MPQIRAALASHRENVYLQKTETTRENYSRSKWRKPVIVWCGLQPYWTQRQHTPASKTQETLKRVQTYFKSQRNMKFVLRLCFQDMTGKLYP